MPLTLEERERLAWINGDYPLARVLATAIDIESEAIDELVFENRMLKNDIATLEAELYEWEHDSDHS